MRHMENTPYEELVFQWHKRFSEERKDVEDNDNLAVP
jgi:hypothetical protein